MSACQVPLLFLGRHLFSAQMQLLERVALEELPDQLVRRN